MTVAVHPCPAHLQSPLPPPVPFIETPRLILRGHMMADWPAFADMLADDAVARYITADGKGQTPGQAWPAFVSHVGHWGLMGFGMFAVEEKTSGRYAGRIGPLYPEGWPDLEIGWVLARDAWGRGYAGEAIRAAADWLFETLPVERFVSLIHPDNAASVRVAEKIGMRPTGATFTPGTTPLDIWEKRR